MSRSKKNSKHFIPELTIRYYQEYRLSNYDWDYHSYIDRWHQRIRYHWQTILQMIIWMVLFLREERYLFWLLWDVMELLIATRSEVLEM